MGFAVVNKKLADLTPDTKNANKGTERGQKMVEDSLRQYGAGRSILIDKHGRIIAGNKTAENFGSIGLEDVLVIRTDGTKLVAVQRTDLDLDEKQAQEMAIADNRAGQVSLDWDIDALKELDVDLAKFWSEDELAVMMPETIPALLVDEDDVPELPEEAKTKPDDLYILGDHRLLCGDSTSITDVDRLMDGQKADMVFTDPPYGIKVQMNNPGTTCKETILGDDTTEVAAAAYNISVALDVPMIFWGANHYAADASLPNSSCWLCWDKQESNNHIDQADCEFAWTNIKGPARIFHHLWAGFRRDSEKGEKRVHPTQKPIALITEILGFFKAGKAILDLFGGSGSTLIACEKTGRRAFLMELDPKYCDVIVTRWETATGKKAVLNGATT